jgi:hypothetical protein
MWKEQKSDPLASAARAPFLLVKIVKFLLVKLAPLLLVKFIGDFYRCCVFIYQP